jgi:tetratricopeptide (TPR) repeat protein
MFTELLIAWLAWEVVGSGMWRRGWLGLHKTRRLMIDKRMDEALTQLDAMDTRKLSPKFLAAWLNLKANALALLGRGDEALDLLDDLKAIISDDDEINQLCAVGNRAIVHVVTDRSELANPLLDETEARAERLRRGRTRPFAIGSLAETWWWRSELARREGNVERRRECLQKAAAFGRGIFAQRARDALERGA